jgi:hypothetical protein
LLYNCLLKHVINGKAEGRIYVRERRRRRRKQLLNDLKERILDIERGTLNRFVWGTRFGRVYGPDVR